MSDQESSNAGFRTLDTSIAAGILLGILGLIIGFAMMSSESIFGSIVIGLASVFLAWGFFAILLKATARAIVGGVNATPSSEAVSTETVPETYIFEKSKAEPDDLSSDYQITCQKCGEVFIAKSVFRWSEVSCPKCGARGETNLRFKKVTI